MAESNDGTLQLELPYEVKLEMFEGPLDLLLHLVRKHELDIFDIPIAFITEKYLEYLDLMKALNLDVAGEFLYYAALLAHIKSKQMLPPDEEEAEGDEEADPAKLLQQRLLEYQTFKEAAEQLADRPMVGRSVWLRGAEPEPVGDEVPQVPPFAEVSLFQLVDAMAKVLARAAPEVSHDVVLDRVSIADRINELLDLLREQERVTFFALFDEYEPGDPGFRIQVVVTFLAILEMTRQRLLRMHQPQGRGEIYLERAMHEVDIPDDALEIDERYD
jgi:segregation and condensation protein A